jgi:hypothetical protein
MGFLYVVVSEPRVNLWVDEEHWLHDIIVFGTVEVIHDVSRNESTVAEWETRTGWTRLA